MNVPSLSQKVNHHTQLLRDMCLSMRNVDQRILNLDLKVEHLQQAVKDGNSTRNIIALLIAAQVLFNGLAAVNWSLAFELLKGVLRAS